MIRENRPACFGHGSAGALGPHPWPVAPAVSHISGSNPYQPRNPEPVQFRGAHHILLTWQSVTGPAQNMGFIRTLSRSRSILSYLWPRRFSFLSHRTFLSSSPSNSPQKPISPPPRPTNPLYIRLRFQVLYLSDAVKDQRSVSFLLTQRPPPS